MIFGIAPTFLGTISEVFQKKQAELYCEKQ